MYESEKYYWKSTNGDLTPVHELKDLHLQYCNETRQGQIT